MQFSDYLFLPLSGEFEPKKRFLLKFLSFFLLYFIKAGQKIKQNLNLKLTTNLLSGILRSSRLQNHINRMMKVILFCLLKKIQDLLRYSSRKGAQRTTKLHGKRHSERKQFSYKNVNTKVHGNRSLPTTFRRIQKMYKLNAKILWFIKIFLEEFFLVIFRRHGNPPLA